MTSPSPTPVRTPLFLIRAALLAGVLLFGAVCWYIVRQRGGGPVSGVDTSAFAILRYMVPVLGFAALSVAIAIRVAISRTRDEAKRNSLRIVGWAVGEGAALAGGIYYMEIGDPRLYLIGTTAMLATFIVVPLRNV